MAAQMGNFIPPPPWSPSAVPFKYHAEHRHHIPKPRYRVTNRAEYDVALKRRGSLTGVEGPSVRKRTGVLDALTLENFDALQDSPQHPREGPISGKSPGLRHGKRG